MRRRWALGACLLPLTLAANACGSDRTVTESEEASTGEADSAADDESQGEDATSAAEADTTTGDEGDTTTTGGGEDNYARGIRITKVEANPGVAVPIAIDGVATGPGQRNARLPQRRPTWLFVHVEVEPGWEARELEAVFTIHRPDGSSLSASQVNEITGSTLDWQEDPEGGAASISEMRDFVGFYIGLPAEEVLPETGISVELREVDPSYLDSPTPAELPVVPAAGSAEDSVPLGIENSNNFFRLVMVPIHFDYGSCDATPDYSDTNMARYVDHLFASIPVENVELVVHEPYLWDSPIDDTGDMGAILNAMGQLKAQENEAPYTYYYALINNCGGCISGGGMGCVAGLAQLAGPGMDTGDSLSRVGSGLLSTSTFVHEIGHTQGRRHVFCEGAGAAGTDDSYPYDNGTLGTSWGFDQREAFLHNPSFGFDYMSYCGPSWVSDWQWEATYDRIETLSSWADTNTDSPAALEQDLLVVTADSEGVQRQFTTRGWIDPTAVDATVEASFVTVQGATASQALPVRSSRIPHSDAVTYVLPAPADSSLKVRIEHEGRSYLVGADQLSGQ